MQYEAAKRGYANLWKEAQITKTRAATARGIAKRLLTNKDRYEKISVQVNGVPWWWIAAIHNMESNANFLTYLGNGQRFNRVTTIEPLNRGPFVSFEAGAVDAIKLKGLHKIEVWDITRALYEAERYNGFGYVGRIRSPYLWSYTTLQQKGKFTSDHNWDPNHVSQQCGVAAIFKAFEELGVLEFEFEEDDMAELRASLIPFGGIAPILIRTLAGPAAQLAVKALTEAFDDDNLEATPANVQKKLEEVPLRKMPDILAMAEEILKAAVGADPEPDPLAPAGPVATTVTTQPAPGGTTTTTVTTQPAETEPPRLGIVDRIFGGNLLAGLKTPIGIILYCAAWAGGAIAPDIFTPEVVTGFNALAATFLGIGLTAKLDWFLNWLKPFVKR